MNIAFTGTRHGMTRRQYQAMLMLASRMVSEHHTFHHGACVGADSQAHEAVRVHSRCAILMHPSNLVKWDNSAALARKEYQAGRIVNVLEPRDPLLRNRDMVEGALLVIAAPQGLSDEDVRGGTWSTIRYARKLGKPLIILDP
jgi:predicted Rossmann fold nucleotide-binding protein DprA/Smf involved in DNA uptake